MLGPLPCLFIGIGTILFLILYLRLHAFLALIASAFLIAVLSDRVPIDGVVPLITGRFGELMGSIGILLAMAAIIGKCLTDSGAAERIVRFFSRAFGAGREHYSILASGFVLSIPVFFDTVFYLLAPLTRAVYARRKKDYVLVVCLAAAGAVLTHALVPPTPGPIIVAEELGVSILTTILVGILACIVPLLLGGLGYSYFINSRLQRKPENVMGLSEEDIEAISQKSDAELPGLFMSFLPVLLPVALLAGSTIALQFTGDGSLRESDLANPATFIQTVQSANTPVSAYIYDQLSDNTKERLAQPADDQDTAPPGLKKALKDINAAMKRAPMHDETRFAEISLNDGASSFVGKTLYKNQYVRFNRALLESAFPNEIKSSPVGAIKWIELFGDKNLVFFAGAIIAIWLLIRQSDVSFGESVEKLAPALASGAIIALITCAGGSFGKSLQVAGIGDLIATYAQNWGIPLLALAYIAATLIRVAQGSATVAMITTAGIIAPALEAVDPGFHAVYFVAVIGFGATGFSWMNDSGFWIFSKMTGLSEADTLKTWTVLLSVLSLAGFGWVWILTKILPLV